MNSRLQSLIDRGYDELDVIELSNYTKDDLDYLSEIALEKNSVNCYSQNNPVAIYIGGQPGCGKTTISSYIKDKYSDIVEIGIDNYRMYHPNYIQMEECIKKHWEGRVANENDTPGNDIADFTHQFSGEMTDEIIKKASNKKYNIAIEWSMREPKEPLESMKNLKKLGYDISVYFVAVNKETSMNACNLRSEIMNSYEHIVRRIPSSFHELCIKSLPDAVDYIHDNGYKKDLINQFSIVTRDCKKVWDAKVNQTNPGEIYNEFLNNKDLTGGFNNKFYAEMALEKEEQGLDKIVSKVR